MLSGLRQEDRARDGRLGHRAAAAAAAAAADGKKRIRVAPPPGCFPHQRRPSQQKLWYH